MKDRVSFGDIVAGQFIQLPTILFKDKKYRDLSIYAKVAYAFLRDRIQSSLGNMDFVDEDGDVFIVYYQTSLAEDMNISERTVRRVIGELKKAGLIDVVRHGLVTRRIYLRRLNLAAPTGQKADEKPSYRKDSPADRSDVPVVPEDCAGTNINHTESNHTNPNHTSTTYVRGRKRRAKKEFIPPTLEEVREFANARGYHFDPDYFYSYYTDTDTPWLKKNGKPILDWKRTMLTWEKRWKERNPDYEEQDEQADFWANLDKIQEEKLRKMEEERMRNGMDGESGSSKADSEDEGERGMFGRTGGGS